MSTKTKFKSVNRAEFKRFIDSYPGKLERHLLKTQELWYDKKIDKIVGAIQGFDGKVYLIDVSASTRGRIATTAR